MATMKRRIIYLSDEQWESLQAQARGEATTISNLIRHGLALVPQSLSRGPATVEFHAPATLTGAEMAKRERERFNSRPFTPVPKKR